MFITAHWFLLAFLGWACVQDLRDNRIRNPLTLALLVTGLALGFTPYGLVTPLQSLSGLLLGFALPFVLFAIGGMGAGDVKLLAGVGAWVGPVPVLCVFVVAIIVAALLGLLISLVRGRALSLVGSTGLVVLNLMNIRSLGFEHVRETGRTCQRSKRNLLPFALPVCIATVLTLFTPVVTLIVGR